MEVHISNVFGREGFRERLVIAGACTGVVSGLGLAGYALAVSHFDSRVGVRP